MCMQRVRLPSRICWHLSHSLTIYAETLAYLLLGALAPTPDAAQSVRWVSSYS
jgi:hypothetical protein